MNAEVVALSRLPAPGERFPGVPLTPRTFRAGNLSQSERSGWHEYPLT